MKQRFSLNAEGLFVDRDGNVLGRITSITVELGTGGRGEIVNPLTAKDEGPTDLQDEGGAGERKMPAVNDVWVTYVEAMKPRSARLDPEERRIIGDALKVRSVAECKLAILGCAASPWHMGDNPHRRKYNRLSQILKGRRASQFGAARTTGETIDFFIDLYEKSGQTFGFTSESSAKIQVLKDRIRRRTSRAEEAKVTLLEKYGIRTFEAPAGAGELHGRITFQQAMTA